MHALFVLQDNLLLLLVVKREESEKRKKKKKKPVGVCAQRVSFVRKLGMGSVKPNAFLRAMLRAVT